MFKSVAIPKETGRQEHSFYKNVVLQVRRNKRKAVFLPHELVRTGYFTEVIRHAARRLGTAISVYCDGSGWYVWYKGDKEYKNHKQ